MLVTFELRHDLLELHDELRPHQIQWRVVECDAAIGWQLLGQPYLRTFRRWFHEGSCAQVQAGQKSVSCLSAVLSIGRWCRPACLHTDSSHWHPHRLAWPRGP